MNAALLPSSPSCLSPFNSNLNTSQKQSPIKSSNFNDLENGLLKVSNCLIKIFKLEPTAALELTKKIFQAQQQLQNGQARRFAATPSMPSSLIITKERIHCLGKKLGEGTFSFVFAATVIATSRHRANHICFSPGKPQKTALKVTKSHAPKHATFSPEKENFRAAANQASEGLDAFLDTFKDIHGVGYSLNVLFDNDLAHTTFQIREVDSILKVLIDCAKGIKVFHDAGWIHRDIKAANILVSFSPSEEDIEEAKGAITDFGFLRKQMTSDHHTAGTPHYLDPSMFGSPTLSLVNQKKRIGLQTKEGDVFALGMTIYRDILKPFFIKAYEDHPEDDTELETLKEALREKIYKGPFTEETLMKYGSRSNYRMMHFFNSKNEECLIEYPPLNDLQKTLNEAVSDLGGLLSEGERRALRGLIQLSCLMQDPDLKKRPPIFDVLAELRKLERSIDDPSARSIKRELATEFEECSEQGASKRAKGDQAEDASPIPEDFPPTEPVSNNSISGEIISAPELDAPQTRIREKAADSHL